MKTKIYMGLGALSAATLLAGVVSAQGLAPGSAMGSGQSAAQNAAPPAVSAARQARVAAGSDRRITQAEFVQARTARLTALDTNHDGTVTAEEMRAHAQARRTERANAMFDRLDTNRDGQISRAEFDAAGAARADRVRGNRSEWKGRHSGRGAEHGPRQGAGERVANREAVSIADVQARAAANFARLDTNHDGVLTADELRAGRQGRDGRGHGRMGRGAHGPATAAQNPASPPAPASE